MDDVRQVRVTLPAVRVAARGLAALVGVLDPDDVGLSEAFDIWAEFDRLERLAANAKTLLAARVEAAGNWKHSGARSAAEHLAQASGTTTSTAKRSLETSRQVRELPVVADALRGGGLSAAQVDAIAPAAAADPAAQGRLLAFAATTNVTELREECLRTRADADVDREATHRRIHASRCLRVYTDGEGGRNLAVRGTPEQVARIELALEPMIDDLFERARKAGQPEPRRRMRSTRWLRWRRRPTAMHRDRRRRRRSDARSRLATSGCCT